MALIVSLVFPLAFKEIVSIANDWVLNAIGWLFSYTALFLFLICIGLFLSPVGKIRLGGPEAKPLFSRWKWFAIVLCTTIATGILFWSTSEPLYHYLSPPVSKDIIPQSEDAEVFSMSTLFLHWSFTPYAIYCVPALIFSLAFFNAGESFSLSGVVRPLLSGKYIDKLAVSIDMICLYALVLGMAASLGAGILMISGGISSYFGVVDDVFLMLVVTVLIVLTFVISAATGLLKGIKYLSLINFFLFVFLLLYVGFYSPWEYLFNLIPLALKDYFLNFFNKSLFTGVSTGDPWPKDWSVFYWANWMAWAPVTALFLGRIAQGRTVREFMIFTWILPSLFAILWMSIFGGNLLAMERSGLEMSNLLSQQGPNGVIYGLFRELPFYELIVPVFLLIVYISYVTAADSNTEAIGGISTKDFFAGKTSPLLGAKISWGVLIGAVSFIMVSYSGIDGIRMLSNLGGVPALFLLIIVGINAFLLLIRSFR